jgi:hypothetical protein
MKIQREIKIISPEKAGELWGNKGAMYSTVISSIPNDGEALFFRSEYDNLNNITKEVIHGKNGWTRLFPFVEDDSVERIEIEGVWFADHYRDAADKDVYTIRLDVRYLEILQNRLPMKMILEIPKES